MRNTIKTALTILAIFLLLALALPGVTASYPISFGNNYPRTVWSDMGRTGTINGMVTYGGDTGVAGAYIAIVNAANESQGYFITTADKYGNFLFSKVNATYSSVNHTGWDGTAATYYESMGMYQIYANISYGNGNYTEGYSQAFGIDADLDYVTYVSVALSPKPAAIVLKAANAYIRSDGQDTVDITAYGHDSSGKPVADGTSITLVVTNQTNMSEPPAWITGNWTPGDGSLNTTGQQIYTAYATGGSGSISTSFGRVPDNTAENNSTIYAYFSGDPSVNASVKISFIPATASWTGYVVDSDGAGYPSLPVTLHVMGRNNTTGLPYEIYAINRTTSASQPFVGLYVFDYILANNAAYGYVTARATITDNLTIDGRSGNYTMNLSRTSIGSIVLNIPPPDGLKVTAEYDTILVGGSSDRIIAQLMLNGLEYKRSGQPVTFTSDNDSVATLPSIRTNSTDMNGQAWIPLTSSQAVGRVNVTGNMTIMYGHDLTDTTTVRVVGWGTVSGIISDQNKIGIPNANVTLWNVQWNSSLGQWENTGIVKIPDNSQLSNDGRNGQTIGLYTFYRVPWDVYKVTGEKEGHSYFAIFVLGPWPGDVEAYKNASEIPASQYGTATHNIAMPEVDYPPPYFLFISPCPKPAINRSTPIPDATTSAPGFESMLALAGLLGVASLIAKRDD
jgi:hypothetical protein